MKRPTPSKSSDLPDRSSLPRPREGESNDASEELAETSRSAPDPDQAESKGVGIDKEEAKWLPRSSTGAQNEGELPDRLRFKLEKDERGEGEGVGCSKEALKELREKYETLGTADNVEDGKHYVPMSRDYRKEHREAIKKRRSEESSDLETGVQSWGGRRIASARSALVWSGLAILILVTVGLTINFSGTVGEKTNQVRPDRLVGEFSDELPTEGVVQVLARFYGAESWQELLSDVRHPEIVGPLMEDWYTRYPYEKMEYEIGKIKEGMVSIGAINDPEQLWVLFVEVTLSHSGLRTFVFVQQSANGFKIDWESSVGYEEMPFDEFASREEIPLVDNATPKEFRITITPADYYTQSFSDEDAWRCFQVRTGTSDRVLYGYVRRGSDPERSINPLFYPGETTIPVIASLRHANPKAKLKGQVEIVDIAQKNWTRHYEIEGVKTIPANR